MNKCVIKAPWRENTLSEGTGMIFHWVRRRWALALHVKEEQRFTMDQKGGRGGKVTASRENVHTKIEKYRGMWLEDNSIR